MKYCVMIVGLNLKGKKNFERIITERIENDSLFLYIKPKSELITIEILKIEEENEFTYFLNKNFKILSLVYILNSAD